jgi:hypothetical protein
MWELPAGLQSPAALARFVLQFEQLIAFRIGPLVQSCNLSTVQGDLMRGTTGGYRGSVREAG